MASNNQFKSDLHQYDTHYLKWWKTSLKKILGVLFLTKSCLILCNGRGRVNLIIVECFGQLRLFKCAINKCMRHAMSILCTGHELHILQTTIRGWLRGFGLIFEEFRVTHLLTWSLKLWMLNCLLLPPAPVTVSALVLHLIDFTVYKLVQKIKIWT